MGHLGQQLECEVKQRYWGASLSAFPLTMTPDNEEKQSHKEEDVLITHHVIRKLFQWQRGALSALLFSFFITTISTY